MNITFRACVLVAIASGFSLVAPLIAADLNVSGNITATGTIDADGSSITVGNPGGASLIYSDAANDTFTELINRNVASWLWARGILTPVTAMRLDSANQLILYQSNGTTAGVTLTPAINPQLSLGTATLTASGTGLSTNGAFTVADGLTNTNGSFTGGAAGLSLEAGGTNQSIALNSSGGDLVFSTSGTERARIKSTGNVGIGTTAPGAKLDVLGGGRFTGGAMFGYTAAMAATNGFSLGTVAKNVAPSGGQGTILIGSNDGTSPLHGWLSLITDSQAASRRLSIGIVEQTIAWRNITLNEGGGSVGIGTASPASQLHLLGSAGTAAPTLGAGTLYLQDSGSAPANGGALIFGAAQGYWAGIKGLINYGGGNTTGDLAFFTRSVSGDALLTEKLRILQNGNVGIGTATPASKFVVNGADGIVARFQAPTNPQIYVQGTTSTALLTASDSAGIFVGSASAHPLNLYANGATRAVIDIAGNFGIGTTTPKARLEIQGAQSGLPSTSGTAQPSASLRLGNIQTNGVLDMGVSGGSSAGAWLQYTNQADLTQTYPLLLNPNGGNVGIGTTTPTHKLAVKGTIRAQEIIVDTGWADYVFDASYRLAPLSEVEAHIKTAKHLPGIPSAAEVAEHGVSMGDMQAKLLSKVEELTLHLIAQEKVIAAQSARLDRLETENRRLRTAAINP